MRLPDELIESLLWSLGAPESGDGQRRSPRVAMGCIAMLTPLEDGCPREAAAREVLVRDISATGASLLLASPVAVRQFVLDIRSSRSGPLSILCSVRHCEKARGGGYAVGAHFIRFLPRQASETDLPGS
jgi:PilZ domain-containing protein